MDLLLIVLGVFGLVPIAAMGFFYTVIPLLLVGLQVLGVAAALTEREAPATAAPDRQLDRAA